MTMMIIGIGDMQIKMTIIGIGDMRIMTTGDRAHHHLHLGGKIIPGSGIQTLVNHEVDLVK